MNQQTVQMQPEPALGRASAVRAGVVGGSGYGGGELLRLLIGHPEVQITYVASRTHAGEPLSRTHPSLLGYTDLVYGPLELDAIAAHCNALFIAAPHGAAMDLAAQALAAGLKVIDIGSDFRLPHADDYATWYGLEHTQGHLLAEAVYGLCEWNRDRIAQARLVSNPGCYPTSALLGLLPLLAAGLIEPDGIVVNALSGVSGAGSTPKPMYHFPERTENIQAYGFVSHRHTPEIEAHLGGLARRPVGPIQFSPHLVPMSRGIHATITARAAAGVDQEAVDQAFHDRYAAEPFVQVLTNGQFPQTKAVAGSNQCHLAARVDRRTGNVLVASVIDNLVKGAAGQAVQNLNLLFGLPETTGLMQPPLFP